MRLRLNGGATLTLCLPACPPAHLPACLPACPPHIYISDVPTRITDTHPSLHAATLLVSLLLQIAENNNVALDEVLKLNPQIENPDLIQIGDVISLPCKGAGEWQWH